MFLIFALHCWNIQTTVLIFSNDFNSYTNEIPLTLFPWFKKLIFREKNA